MYYPSATYRVQLNSSFTFSQLQDIVDYLHKLGISTIYASPITKAMKGSTHGYDVCNPDVLNAEIGTEAQLEDIHQSLFKKKMGWLQDIVPNHMAFLCDNERITDVMERGPQSPYYRYFDIDWNHYNPAYKGKLMVPFIGKELKQAVKDGDLKIMFDKGGFHLANGDDKYPVAIDSISFLFSFVNDNAGKAATHQLLGNINAEINEWNQAKARWLQDVLKNEAQVQEVLLKVNDDKALLQSFLDHQYYIFTWYKVTEQEINFRRFFTVNQLICLRMEDESVFDNYHRLVKKLSDKDLLQGLRIDHIDGLYNPKEYGKRLRNLMGDETYIIAEKILEYNEDFAGDWQMQGTSGYEFLSFTNQLLTDKKGGGKLLSFYKELVPQTQAYKDIVWEKKHNFLLTQMGGELENLMHLIEDLHLLNKQLFEPEKLKDALGNLMASFPVYRIYPQGYPLDKEALMIADTAFEKALKKAGEAGKELALLKTLFYIDGSQPGDDDKLLFLKRLMQFTGPLAAKGVEDTTFYVYNPLVSHNEVGDAPSQLGVTIEKFHDKMQSRQRNNPYSLNATSTHDIKRGEDARMRINALASLPDEWMQMVNNWRQTNKPFIKEVNNKTAPSANDEYFIYQSLIGAFPEDFQVTDAFRERTYAFLEKALREAKVETTYCEPNAVYEQACKNFVTALLDASHPFLESFIPFLKKIITTATLYSLAQTVIKITAPGVPDVYQGCELWDTSYVDPDNRRPVDYTLRKTILDNIIEKEKQGNEILFSYLQKHLQKGAGKLFITYRTLCLRRAYNDVFLHGEYKPLQTSSDKTLAYERSDNRTRIIVIVPLSDTDKFFETEVHFTNKQNTPTSWKNIYTNEAVISVGNTISISATTLLPITVLVSGDKSI